MKINADKLIAALLRRSGSSLRDLAAADCETILWELKQLAAAEEHKVKDRVPRKHLYSLEGNGKLN